MWVPPESSRRNPTTLTCLFCTLMAFVRFIIFKGHQISIFSFVLYVYALSHPVIGAQETPAHLLVLQIKFYWNTAMHTFFRGLCGCLCAIRAELSGCHRDCAACRAKYVYYLAFCGEVCFTVTDWLTIGQSREEMDPMYHYIGFWPWYVACGILVPRPGMKLECTAVGGQCLNTKLS